MVLPTETFLNGDFQNKKLKIIMFKKDVLIVDSERSENTIDFTQMCVFIYLFFL